MMKIRFDAKKHARLFSAVLCFFFAFNSVSYSQSGKWVLCLNPPERVHFFHDSQTSECRNRIAVTAIAYLIGGTNIGLRATISDDGKFIEAERRLVYLPRGTPVLVLDLTPNGRRLVYAWNTHTFLLMTPYVEPDGRKSYSWQNFDDRFQSGQFAITLQKTQFFSVTVDPTASSSTSLPAEVPSGRLVEAYEVAQVDGVERRGVRYGKFFGYVDVQHLRAISQPNLNVGSKYYVGSRLVRTQVVKSCGVSESISDLRERTSASGLSGGITVEKIAELAAEYNQTSRSSQTLKQEIPANVRIEAFTMVTFVEPAYRGLFRGDNKPGDRVEYNFTTVSSCDSKKVQVVISQGTRAAIAFDGPIIIRNEDDFDQYRADLIGKGFTNDEAFFIIALTSTVKR